MEHLQHPPLRCLLRLQAPVLLLLLLLRTPPCLPSLAQQNLQRHVNPLAAQPLQPALHGNRLSEVPRRQPVRLLQEVLFLPPLLLHLHLKLAHQEGVVVVAVVVWLVEAQEAVLKPRGVELTFLGPQPLQQRTAERLLVQDSRSLARRRSVAAKRAKVEGMTLWQNGCARQTQNRQSRSDGTLLHEATLCAISMCFPFFTLHCTCILSRSFVVNANA